MNILITGGTGYIGSMLTDKLLKMGHKVYVVDIGIYNTYLNLSQRNLIIYKEDIRYINWKSVFDQHIDIVYHFAGVSNDPGYGITNEIGYSINYEATIRLYNECEKNKVSKFIFPSSCSVYGRQANNSMLLNESSALNPLTNYALLKAKVEDYILNHPSTNYTILRPSTVYGYSYRQRFDLVINEFIAKIYNNENVHVSNKDNIRPSLYIDDLISIYTRLLDCKESNNKVYNVSTNNYSLNETFYLIKRLYSSESILLDDSNSLSRSYKVCSNKLLSLFPDFSFASFDDGIEPLLNKFKIGMFKDYATNPNYYGRLRQPMFLSGANI